MSIKYVGTHILLARGQSIPYDTTFATHHSRLVVVLGRRQRCHARAFSRRMVERRRHGPAGQGRGEVERVVLLHRQGTRLGPRVQRPQPIARAPRRRPIFGNRQYLAAPQQTTASGIVSFQNGHPVRGLVVVRRANNGHVKKLTPHGRHGGLLLRRRSSCRHDADDELLLYCIERERQKRNYNRATCNRNTGNCNMCAKRFGPKNDPSENLSNGSRVTRQQCGTRGKSLRIAIFLKLADTYC